METEEVGVESPFIRELHEYRKQIDACIKVAENYLSPSDSLIPPFGREMALVCIKLQEAKMWAGKCLEVLGSPFPQELRDEAIK